MDGWLWIEVHELSVASMILSSLNMQDIPSNKVCDKCSSPICKRHVITQFPEFLPISISRTFFDTTTYSLTKDCSHITINSNLTLQGVSVWNDFYCRRSMFCTQSLFILAVPLIVVIMLSIVDIQMMEVIQMQRILRICGACLMMIPLRLINGKKW